MTRRKAANKGSDRPGNDPQRGPQGRSHKRQGGVGAISGRLRAVSDGPLVERAVRVPAPQHEADGAVGESDKSPRGEPSRVTTKFDAGGARRPEQTRGRLRFSRPDVRDASRSIRYSATVKPPELNRGT